MTAERAASTAQLDEISRSSTTCAGIPVCAANFRPSASARLLITAATPAASPAPPIASMLLPRPGVKMTTFLTPLFYCSDYQSFRSAVAAACGNPGIGCQASESDSLFHCAAASLQG